MARTSWRFAALLFASSASAACAPERARLTLDLQWEGGAPSEPKNLVVTVQHTASTPGKGTWDDEKMLVERAAGTYDPVTGAAIELSVPNGHDYNALVEVLDLRDTVEYLGSSGRFDLSPDPRFVQRVWLRKVPAARLKLAEERPARGGLLPRVAKPQVELEVWPVNANIVTVSNDDDFTAGKATARFVLGAPEQDTHGPRAVAWDLNAGVCGGASEPACEDGERKVFVQFADAERYLSKPVTYPVELDSAGPVVSASNVPSELAGLDHQLNGSFRTNEPAKFVSAPLGIPGLSFATPPDIDADGYARNFSFTWQAPTAVPPPALQLGQAPSTGPRTYTLSLPPLVDDLGNVAQPEPLGTLTLDVQAPVLVGDAVFAPENGAEVSAGATVMLTFTASEAIAVPHVTVRGEEFECAAAEDAPVYRCTGPAVQVESGDGPRDVQATLVDAAGNRSTLQLGSLSYKVDLPRTGGSTLLREPAYPAAAGGNDVYFSPQDPFTADAVSAVLRVIATKALPAASGAPALDVWQVPEGFGACPENPAAARLAFQGQLSAGSELIYRHTFSAQDAPGSYCFRITWGRNARGRPISEVLPQRLHFANPAQPVANAVDFARTLFRRVPWGSEQTSGQPSFRVAGALKAGNAAAHVIVSRPASGSGGGSEPCSGASALGAEHGSVSTAPGSNGSAAFDVPLSGDRVDVCAASVDRSGNVSAFALVTEGEWVATLGGKVRGSTLDNPHSAFEWGSAEPILEPPYPGVEIDGAQWGQVDQARVSTQAKVAWHKLLAPLPTGVVAPPPRVGHAMAYDAARGRVVLFGGRNAANAPLNDTWEWDGASWQLKLMSSPAPSARVDAAMVYDAARGKTLLFGGRIPGGDEDDTWEWDGVRWRELEVAGPPRRSEHALAYDSRRGVSVLFGGQGETSLLQDTWEWDGTRWSEKSSDGPTPRVGHALAYNPLQSSVVLFGGWDNSSALADAWTWDGSAWCPFDVQVDPDGAVFDIDLPRAGHSMAFDPTRQEMLVFGGCQGIYPCVTFDDLLALDQVLSFDARPGAAPTWLELWPPDFACGPGGEHPCMRQKGAAAFDTTRNRWVVFGGQDPAFFVFDDTTWEWSPEHTRWTRREPRPPMPAPRSQHSMTYVADEQRVLLFGSNATDGSASARETWTWDGEHWLRTSTGTGGSASPPPRRDQGLTFDPARGAVLFGGLGVSTASNELWFWRAGAWTAGPVPGACNDTTQPCPRHKHSLGFDVARSEVLLFGGLVPGAANDLWAFAGNWRRVTPASAENPSPRSEHAWAYDPIDGNTVLFGGQSAGVPRLGDTWIWNGESWRLAQPSAAPAARLGHAMAYDSARGRVVLFSGDERDDFWEWDAAEERWLNTNPLPGAPRPPGLTQHAVAYEDSADAALRRGILFGGRNASTQFGETWAWRAPSRPAHTLAIDLEPIAGRCRLHGGEACEAELPVALTSVSVSATSGGRGTPQAGEPTGAELLGWNAEGWLGLAANAAPETAPAALGWQTQDAELIRNLSGSDKLHFQLRPRYETAHGELAELATDYVEVAVRYRLAQPPEGTPTTPRTCPALP